MNAGFQPSTVPLTTLVAGMPLALKQSSGWKPGTLIFVDPDGPETSSSLFFFGGKMIWMDGFWDSTKNTKKSVHPHVLGKTTYFDG